MALAGRKERGAQTMCHHHACSCGGGGLSRRELLLTAAGAGAIGGYVLRSASAAEAAKPADPEPPEQWPDVCVAFLRPKPKYWLGWPVTAWDVNMCEKYVKKSRALIIGGGIAGVTVAQRLGRAGAEVHLVERQEEIGGRLRDMGCKATDVCLRCNVCLASEILRSVRGVPGVTIHASTELARLRPGTNGARFSADLATRDPGGSATCSTVDIDAVVIAAGYEPYDPVENSSYNFDRLPNLITGEDAERQLAVDSRITRVSDGETARRIAFVQCVGSRTEEIHRRPEDTDYCSAVCCAYALRIARRLKHQADDSEVTIFYMDIQNIGKGFDAFYAECRDKVRFVRARPYEYTAGPDGTVCVAYAPEAGDGGGTTSGCVCKEEFDLVILSVGIRPPNGARDLADRLDVALDEQGFFGVKEAAALPDLRREGVFVVGACESPKDMAGCIAQAEAISATVLSGV